MVFRQALLETRAIQAEVPTKLVEKFSLILCWKAFPKSLSEGHTIYILSPGAQLKYHLKYVKILADFISIWISGVFYCAIRVYLVSCRLSISNNIWVLNGQQNIFRAKASSQLRYQFCLSFSELDPLGVLNWTEKVENLNLNLIWGAPLPTLNILWKCAVRRWTTYFCNFIWRTSSGHLQISSLRQRKW